MILKNSSRRKLALALPAVAAIVLAACAPPRIQPAAPAAPAAGAASAPVELTIITVNNSDMKTMQSFTDKFEAAHKNIKLKWVVLPENELRARVTTDVASGTGSFDVVTVGTYEVPIWAKNQKLLRCCAELTLLILLSTISW